MTTLANFNAWVVYRVPGRSTIVTSAQVDEAVLQAVDLWSKYKPQHLIADIAGDGGYDYDLPAGFTLGFSQIERIEYPAGERLTTYLDPDDYTVYKTASTTAQIRFYRHTPATGETARVAYTAQHAVGASSTIMDVDEQAVADLAAAYVCEALSSFFAQSTDGSLVVDSRDYQSQAAEYALRAKRYRDLALQHLGISTTTSGNAGAGSVVPAGAVIRDFDSQRMDKSIRLTHPQT